MLQAETFKFESTFEYQTSSEGTETAVPFGFEYGLTSRLEIMVEPVFYTAIRPDQGAQATGAGDLEVTLTYLLHHEGQTSPAFAVAGEIKFPTAQNPLIGTGKTDYTGYLIASKRFGKTDIHANLGYSVLGAPKGIQLNNIFNYALAAEYHVQAKMDLVAEILGNTSSFPESGAESPVAPEIAGGEFTAMIGTRYYIRHGLVLCMGVSYDNNQAFLIRPGVTIRF